MGLKPKSKSESALVRGSALHNAVEQYLKGKVDQIDDPLAVLHQAVIDARKVEPGLAVEQYYKFERAGIVLRGYIDLYTERGIWDHKTTSDLKRYGEKPETIAQNLQLNLYAWHWFSLYPDAPTCTVGHIQYQTKGAAKVALVEATLTREQVEQFLIEVIDPLLKAQKEVALLPGPEYVEPSKDACWNYGGCPFKDRECKPYHYREHKIVSETKPKKRIVMLFLSCRPLNRACEPLEDLISEVANSEDVPALHPDLVEYGKGAATFAHAIVRGLEQRENSDPIYIYARRDDKTARALIVYLRQSQSLTLHDVVEGVS
jgi:hypothetical protein